MPGLSKKAQQEKFVPIKDKALTSHPGVARLKNRNPFCSENRSRFLIGGYKFGFGHRRRFWNGHISKVLGEDPIYKTRDIFINSLEDSPEPTDRIVSQST